MNPNDLPIESSGPCRLTHHACDCVVKRMAKLEAVAKAAQSVLSEEGVREYLSSYVMGVELINRLEALEAE